MKHFRMIGFIAAVSAGFGETVLGMAANFWRLRQELAVLSWVGLDSGGLERYSFAE
jgi:hypothetical protein